MCCLESSSGHRHFCAWRSRARPPRFAPRSNSSFLFRLPLHGLLARRLRQCGLDRFTRRSLCLVFAHGAQRELPLADLLAHRLPPVLIFRFAHRDGGSRFSGLGTSSCRHLSGLSDMRRALARRLLWLPADVIRFSAPGPFSITSCSWTVTASR